MKRGQLELLADTVKDIANIAAGAMVFGQSLSEQPFSIGLALLGILLWLGFVTAAVGLKGWMKEKRSS